MEPDGPAAQYLQVDDELIGMDGEVRVLSPCVYVALRVCVCVALCVMSVCRSLPLCIALYLPCRHRELVYRLV